MTIPGIAVLLLLAIASAGCGSASTPTSADTPTVTGPSTELFASTLGVRASSFYSFTVSESGSVRVTLASLVAPPRLAALTISVGLGVGIPAGEGCAMNNTVAAAPDLTAQLVVDLAPGIYCVNVFDAGTLTGPVNFAIRIVHP